MFEIPVFKSERDAGLAKAIQAQANISYASLAEPLAGFCDLAEAKARVSKHVLATAGGGAAAHMNLHPFKSVLVSIGWNKNDDVFDPMEVWAARSTPEDQPINIEHDSTKIRGHITGQYAVNAKMERLADDLAADELPDRFHIVTSGVLYKRYDDEDVQKEMNSVIEELAEGKWYVSMECLLRGFDYAVIDAKGKHHVVPRSEESAFLTKHLRAYGGDGKYQGYKVGRLLRNITFSGKGLVKKPANPESVILAEASAFSGTRQEISQVFSSSGYESSTETTKGNNHMPNELELLQTQLKSLEAQLKATTDEKNAAVASLKEVETQKLTSLQDELKAKSEEVEALKSKASELGADLSNTKAKLNEVENELTKLQTEAKATKRISTLKEKLEITEAEATEMANTMVTMSDEAFAQAADYMAKKAAEYKAAPANKPAVTENEEGEGHPKAPGLETKPATEAKPAAVNTVKVNDTPRQKAGKGVSTIETATSTEEDPNAANANANVDDATVDTDATLAAAGELANEKIESTRAAVAEFWKNSPYRKNRGRRNQTKE